MIRTFPEQQPRSQCDFKFRTPNVTSSSELSEPWREQVASGLRLLLWESQRFQLSLGRPNSTTMSLLPNQPTEPWTVLLISES